MSKATFSIAGATFPELLEQLWQARHDGDVLVRFSGGVPQYLELLSRTRLQCVHAAVECGPGRLPRARARG
jgi:hypothetical protein